MNRCSPVDMRNNLEVVQILKDIGIDFVPVPVSSKEQKAELVALLWERLESFTEQSSENAA